ncbi:hypothetical protein [Streptomyces sp. Mg1]|uniref:hypothetical protein n=1 Tax=Streptomyces sp. Mg1 TaxID=465541 RepID=UPI00017E7FA3|nr:hypothetical protein [Streptomyces sp. Mg1]AKL68112.1 hypothetical protein M444_24835 [Streptomyces sp. Mg1]EDX21897.1 hypothetical protein SSAG_01688 [Streptomyces sp. Mg1]
MDDLLDVGFDLTEATEPRLPLFTMSEAHEPMEVLQHFGATHHGWGAQARHFAAELAARVPSRDR